MEQLLTPSKPTNRAEVDEAGIFVGEVPCFINNPENNEKWLYVCMVCLHVFERKERQYDEILNGNPFVCSSTCRRKWITDTEKKIEKENTNEFLNTWFELLKVSSFRRNELREQTSP